MSQRQDGLTRSNGKIHFQHGCLGWRRLAAIALIASVRQMDRIVAAVAEWVRNWGFKGLTIRRAKWPAVEA